MDDVYISDPRQASAQVIAQKKKDKQNSLKRRNFRQFLFDLIVKTIICSAIISIDFTLFAEAGSYNLFDINQLPTIEAQYIYAGIVAICFIVIFLLSFSAFLQNVAISITFAALVLSIFNQFALFDQSSILYSFFGSHIDSSISGVFINYSDWLIAGIIALISLILISYTSRSNQIYLLGILILILGGIISKAYFNPVSRNFENKKALSNISKHDDGENFIFLSLPNFASYSDIKNAESKNYTVNQVADNILGFYAINNFTHYPNAYVNKFTNDFINLVAALNPEENPSEIENVLLDNVILDGYWNFKDLDTDKLYLKTSKLYNHLMGKKYNIKVFQTRGIELCTINNSLSVSKCVEKINSPINLNQPGLTDLDKTILLTAQWIESTKIVSNINLPLLAASYLTSRVAPLNFAGSKLYTINSHKIFDMIADDIKASKGNNAYFAVINLPSSTYVYDDFCNIKNPYQWIGASQQPWVKTNNLKAKQQAYAEQTNCLVGQLENFMQKLKKNDKLKKTTIIIQGMSPSGVFFNKTQNMKDFSRVGMAIYTPKQDKMQTVYDLCSVPSIISGKINNNKCTELLGQNTTDKRRQEILKEAHAKTINEQGIFNAVRRFKEWYQAFAGHNNLDNILSKVEKSDVSEAKEKNITEKTDAQDIIVEKVTVAETVEELPSEDKVKSISVVSQEINAKEQPQKQVQDTSKAAKQSQKSSQNKTKAKAEQIDKSTVIPLTKPEQLKKEYRERQRAAENKKQKTKPEASKVNIEVKVIENNVQNLDVIPPAVLGDTQYKPAETTE